MDDPRDHLFDDEPPRVTDEPAMVARSLRQPPNAPGKCQCPKWAMPCPADANEEDLLCQDCRPTCQSILPKDENFKCRDFCKNINACMPRAHGEYDFIRGNPARFQKDDYGVRPYGIYQYEESNYKYWVEENGYILNERKPFSPPIQFRNYKYPSVYDDYGITPEQMANLKENLMKYFHKEGDGNGA